MALIKEIAIGLSVNSGQFTGKMAAADKTMGKFAATADKTAAATNRLDFAAPAKGITRITSLASTAGAAIAALGAGLALRGAVTQIMDIAKSGANLNAILSKTGVIFGDSAGIITGEADKVASSVGGIKTEFVDAATSFGSVFKGLGKSQEESAKLGVSLAKLGMDLASFEGVANDQAFTAISSALRGEFDPIERFRVFLTADKIAAEALASGLAKTKGEITEYAKKTATLNLILQQTTDAQGDLSRTAMDADNQIKAIGGRITNLRDDLGMVFRPVTEAISQLTNTVLVELESMVVANRQAFADWAKEAGASGGLVTSVFDSVVGGVGFAADAIQALNIALKSGQALILDLAASGVDAFISIGSAIGDAVRAMAGMAPVAREADNAIIDAMKAAAKAANEEAKRARAAPWASEAIQGRGNAVRARAGAGNAAVPAAKPPAAAARVDPVSKEVLKAQDKALKDYAADTKKVFEDTRRPMEQYQAKLAELNKLFAGGGLDEETFARAKVAAREDAFGKDENKFAGALTSGSAEAYSAQLKFMNQGAGIKDEPIKEVAKKTGEQVDVSRLILAGINKLVDKAAGAGAEVFAF